SSQMYTPGPEIRRSTCFCDLPQKEHLKTSPFSLVRATAVLLLGAQVRPAYPPLLASPRRLAVGRTTAPPQRGRRGRSSCGGAVAAARRIVSARAPDAAPCGR